MLRGVAELARTADERRAAFADALIEALNVRRKTQQALGEALGVKQPTVSGWIRREAEPTPETVFAIERALELPPGHLSRHLGYLPPEAVKAPPATFEAVVTGDPLLEDYVKRALIEQYRALTSRRAGRGGRPRKR